MTHGGKGQVMVDIGVVLKRVLEADNLKALYDGLSKEEIEVLLTQYHKPVEEFVRANGERLQCTRPATWLLYDYMGPQESDDVFAVCDKHMQEAITPRTYYMERLSFVEMGPQVCGFIHKTREIDVE
jgi:hypothetical protein